MKYFLFLFLCVVCFVGKLYAEEQPFVLHHNRSAESLVEPLVNGNGNSNVVDSACYDRIRICWDYNQRRFVNAGVYSRLKKLSNGSLMCVYSTANDVFLRMRTDAGWQAPIRVATDSLKQYSYTNSELIELANGTLMYAWNARSTNNSGKPYKIMAAYSDDGGRTWRNEQDIYIAGSAWDEGCWEPVMLQLPTGELQLYFANEYQVPNKQQNITMMRSFDNGVSWLKPEVVCFRAGSRDGMPVPVFLQHQKGIALAIEDNGLNGTFKPVIIHTQANDNWKSGAVLAKSNRRWSALAPAAQLDASVYAGAPYLIQLSTGETLLSVQSSEGRLANGTLDCSIMKVYVGNDEARHFCCPSTPFPFEPMAKVNTLWCAMEQMSEDCVMATASVSGLNASNGIWTSTGYVYRPIKARRVETNVADWKELPAGMFLGADSPAQAFVRMAWSADSLFFHFDVKDACIRNADVSKPIDESDGVEFCFDRKMYGTATPKDGLYKCIVNVAGAESSECMRSGVYSEWLSHSRKMVSVTPQGYEITVSVPWTSVGGKPETGYLAVFFQLHNNDGTTVIHESMSGATIHNPATWLRCTLTE